MNDCNPNWLPCPQVALGSDPDSVPMAESWGYSSVVGMLLYLAMNTRPDIAFAVSQVARYSSKPKQSHATAVKQIIRYLKRTKDKGIVMKPNGNLGLDCYVDADFAGMYGQEVHTDPTSVKSRSGYIIMLGGCPLMWKSQLQSHIALSTLEAEYYALSRALRELIPIRKFLLELLPYLTSLPANIEPTMYARVFEDNQGCLSLATTRRITNRTKHFAAESHHFWETLDEDGDIAIEGVATGSQDADYLTKGLPRAAFEANRHSVQGW
jgi:hypothetical protein